MDWYSIFKFLHVTSAVCWVGGGAVLMFLAILAGRAKDDDAQMVVIKQTASLATVWFIPASLATVVFGLVVATIGGLWGSAWVILGLAGFASTFLTGLLLLEPQGRKIGALIAEGQMVDAVAAGKRLLSISKFDYSVMLVVIIDMVMKPGLTDVVVLAVMAAIVAGGAIVFLGPVLARTPAAPASA